VAIVVEHELWLNTIHTRSDLAALKLPQPCEGRTLFRKTLKRTVIQK
jgi:hypothetical protein